MGGKQKDAMVILKLYELRRDETFRRARAWFASEFDPQSAEEIVELMRGGYQESAQYRMVTSYWDTAASLVHNRAVDEKLFLEANTEHMAVYAKLQPFLADVRAIFGVPDYLMHLERMVLRVPGAEEYLPKLRQLLKRWVEVGQKQKGADQRGPGIL